MPDWYPLKPGLAFRIVPGNIKHVWVNMPGFDGKSLQLIVISADRLAVDPGAMRNDGSLFWLNRFEGFKLNVSL